MKKYVFIPLIFIFILNSLLFSQIKKNQIIEFDNLGKLIITKTTKLNQVYFGHDKILFYRGSYCKIKLIDTSIDDKYFLYKTNYCYIKGNKFISTFMYGFYRNAYILKEKNSKILYKIKYSIIEENFKNKNF